MIITNDVTSDNTTTTMSIHSIAEPRSARDAEQQSIAMAIERLVRGWIDTDLATSDAESVVHRSAAE